jgi:phosphoesterase RecJ-like protein
VEITQNSKIQNFSQKLKEKIIATERVILFQHKSPDLDSLGSNIGFINYIKHFKPNAEIFILSTDEPSRNMYEKVKSIIPEHFIILDPSKFDYKNSDLLVFIDFAEISRATKFPEFQINSSKNVFVIDHHIVNPIYENSYVEPSNQSASSIIYELLTLEGIEIQKTNYEFIIMGILGDSGFLRYRDNKFTQTLGIISKFITKFGNESYYEIIESLEQNRPLEEYNLQKVYLNNLVFRDDFAYTSITNQQRAEAGVSHSFSETTNGAVLIRNIEKTKFVFSITQDQFFEDRFNLSFRTCSGSKFVVRELAEKLGGGGHAFAAGAQVKASNIETVVNLVVSAINELNRI